MTTISDSDEFVNQTVPPSGAGCVECEATGSWWFHLRRCATCGHIGCCDDSLGQHASVHAEQTGHPIIRSFEPSESWFWDYRTEQAFDGPPLAPPLAHPASQSTPGPASRVPAEWEQVLAEAAAGR